MQLILVLTLYTYADTMHNQAEHTVYKLIIFDTQINNLIHMRFFSENLQPEATDLTHPAAVDVTIGACKGTVRIEHRLVQKLHALNNENILHTLKGFQRT